MLLEWVPRQVNAEADRLADGDFQGFNPEMRVVADFGKVRWLVLDRLMEAGLAFERSANRLRERRGAGGVVCKKKRLGQLAGGRLKEREPW